MGGLKKACGRDKQRARPSARGIDSPMASWEHYGRIHIDLSMAQATERNFVRHLIYMHTCVLVADDREIYAILDRFTNYDEEPKPDSRWDYFGIGGSFAGALPLNPTSACAVKRRCSSAGVIPARELDRSAR